MIALPMNPAKLRFGTTPKPPVSNYAQPAKGNGNQFLRLYETQPAGIPFPWLFAHRENAKAAVHALTIVEDSKGRQFVHLLVTKRPPLGGQLSIELPAGLWGDKDNEESALNAANREVREETGYHVQRSRMLADNRFATSPGMTTEQKAFALTLAKGEPGKAEYDGEEGAIIVDKINVPLAVFANHTKFMAWLNQMDQAGYSVGMDVLAARGLLPPTKRGRLDIQG